MAHRSLAVSGGLRRFETERSILIQVQTFSTKNNASQRCVFKLSAAAGPGSSPVHPANL